LVGYVLAVVALGALARKGWDRARGKMALALVLGNALIYVLDTLIDLLENVDSVQPDEGFNTADELKHRLFGIMSVLDDRERNIVEEYYGLTGTPRTLEDIGGDFSLTKERVRQIKEKALRKLRNESSTLFDYL